MVIFVSYSAADQPRVEALIVELGVLGYNVSLETKQRGGSLRWRAVFKAIAAADIFVFAVTPTALASSSRRIEYDYALALGKPVLAVRLADEADLTRLPPEIVYLLDDTPEHPAGHDRMAAALAALPPAAPVDRLPPDPETADLLAQIDARIYAPVLTARDKQALLLNLQELLERRETFDAAASMFAPFADRIEPDDEIASAVAAARRELNRLTSSARQWRRYAVLLLVPALIIAAALMGMALLRQVTRGSSAPSTERIEGVLPLPSTSAPLDFVYVGITVIDAPAGVRVIEVGSAASDAGVRVGDDVIAVDLVAVSTADEFYRAMNQRRAPDRVSLRLRRGREISTASLLLGSSDYAAPTAIPSPAAGL